MTRSRIARVVAAVLALVVLLVIGAGCRSLGPVHYPEAITWLTYEAGLAKAKAEGKPIMLIFGADWCRPCHELADHVLSDPRVQAAAQGFVVVHVNVEQREDLDRKYRRGGSTLPRVYFLTADGALLVAARHPFVCSAYGYHHKDPKSLLEGMGNALRLARDPATKPEEDPYALKVAEACTPKPDDKPCVTCTKKYCCAGATECLRQGAACLCGLGPAMKAVLACSNVHCPTECRDSQPKESSSP